MLHICNRLLLGTERVSLGAFGFHSALSFRMWLLRRAKTSKSFVRSSRLVRKRMRLVSGEFTKNGLIDTCCEQLGVLILATTHGPLIVSRTQVKNPCIRSMAPKLFVTADRSSRDNSAAAREYSRNSAFMGRINQLHAQKASGVTIRIHFVISWPGTS